MTTPATTTNASIALAACMRNEGLFLMEWIAHHIVLGFDRIIIVSNDCTDGSDALLDHLMDRGLITHIRQTLLPDQNPQIAGMDHVLKLCREQGHSHVLHIDSDEFVSMTDDDGQITDLICLSPNADVISLAWRFFGDSGLLEWTPGDLIIEKNHMAEPAPNPKHTKFKSLFRVDKFARASEHCPMDPLVDDPIVCSADGRKLKSRTLFYKRAARYKPVKLATRAETAWLSHYAIRARDVFLMKNDRGKGTGIDVRGKYRVGSAWHKKCNHNDAPDQLMQRYLPGIKQRLAEWRKDSRTTELEQICYQFYKQRRAVVLTDAQINRWTITKNRD